MHNVNTLYVFLYVRVHTWAVQYLQTFWISTLMLMKAWQFEVVYYYIIKLLSSIEKLKYGK